jgi:diguanylate cyclase (GGDEF)-like protein
MHPNAHPTPPSILLVDDDVMTIRALSKALHGLGTLHFAKGGHEALRMARSETLDLIVLDAEMPLMNGFQVCEALKADPALAHIPVIFVTSHAEQDVEQAGMAIGAIDFVAKPIRPLIVAARVAAHIRVKRAADELRSQALRDGLTGLANRRAFEESLGREWARGQRRSEPLSVMMIGIDGFKAYTAQHGRRKGDASLVGLAQILTECLKRPSDLASRYGDDTFALMLPCTSRNGATEVARRVLQRMKELRATDQPSHEAPSVNVWVGFSSYDEECDNWISDGRTTRESVPFNASATDLIEGAILALEQARRCGPAEDSFVSVYRALAERMADQPNP